jgi:hypothetical protein
MVELGAAQPAPSKEQIIGTLKDDLMNLVASDVRGDIDVEKVYQYAQAKKNVLYDKGRQYLVPQMVSGQIADWTPLGNTKYSDQSTTRGRYDNVINRLRGDRKKFVAILGQRAPTVKCMPNRSDDEEAIRIARRADIEARRFYFDWEVDRQQRQLASNLWKISTTFGYQTYVADAEKYGTTDEPVYELKDQQGEPGSFHCMQCGTDTPEPESTGTCPQCGAELTEDEYTPPQNDQVPTVTGSKSYPKGAVEFALATVFEVTTPFYVKSIEELPWLLYEYDEHTGRILKLYPQLREKLKDDGGFTSSGTTGGNAATQGTIARDTAASPMSLQSTSRKNRTLYTRIWLHPLMYELVKSDQNRQMLVENFPTGAKLTIVLGEIVDIEEERIQDHWTHCKPDVSEYIYADPICADLIGIQDITNDMHNIAVETAERSIPWFLFDPQVLDPAQMRKHALLPGEGVPAKAGVGQQLQNSIWKAPVSELNTEVGRWTDALWETGREISGALPSVFGGAGGPQKTAHQAELDRNQALMQWSLVWSEMRSFWAKSIENGIRLFAKYGAAHGAADEGEGSQLASLAELETGEFHCETEEQMPIPWNQRRDFFMSLLDKGPAVWGMLGLQHPNNLPQIQQVLGMDGWVLPNLDNRDKVYKVIGELLQSSPIHDPATGKVDPSVPIDIFEDDHALSAQIVKEWCQSDPGRIAKDTKPDGYSNVVAWGMAHLDLTMPPPPDAGAPGIPATPAPADGPPAPGQHQGPSGAPTGHPPAPEGHNVLPFPGQNNLPKLAHPPQMAANGQQA